ncbi:MAG TPA: hypothetical protein VN748_17325 [Pseudonocardiaceae bacterium]|nr:hypothetical protein [Pseudonocardiaceae bacterium]
MSTTAWTILRMTVLHPAGLGAPRAIMAGQRHAQRRGATRTGLAAVARGQRAQPTTQDQLMPRDRFTARGVRPCAATPHRPAAESTARRAVELP